MLFDLAQGVAPKLTGPSELGKTRGGRVVVIGCCFEINSQFTREGKH